MPIPNLYRDLITRLTERTAKGKLSWSKGANKYTFLYSFEKWTVRLADVGEEDETAFEVSILNHEGDQVDGFVLSMGDEDFPVIGNLWGSARRQSLGIGEALREMESELRKLAQEDDGEKAFQ